MSMLVAQSVSRVGGEVRVPGDKSISHRALMLAALADGDSLITGFLPGADCLATLAAIRAMGVHVAELAADELRVSGVGLDGLQPPAGTLDMGNSGTAIRLFTGLLAAQPFDSTLTGDESLRRRPMERVAAPLRLMGARIETAEGMPPIRIQGSQQLRGIEYVLPVASAQVKSAILLAALYARGETTVLEPAVTRDHTERMLRQFGWTVATSGSRISLHGGSRLRAARVDVPGDLSSAAFLLLAGCLAPAGEVVIRQVGLNPTRTGILRILELMGADLEVRSEGGDAAEPVGTLVARPSRLRGIVVPPELVPLAIDEFPVVFVAAAYATGETLLRGAAELRHKESDRIAVMARNLRALGARCAELPDGVRIQGGPLHAGTVDCAGDHRVAMSLAVAGLRSEGPIRILDTSNVATSYPGFVEQVRALGLDVTQVAEDA